MMDNSELEGWGDHTLQTSWCKRHTNDLKNLHTNGEGPVRKCLP